MHTRLRYRATQELCDSLVDIKWHSMSMETLGSSEVSEWGLTTKGWLTAVKVCVNLARHDDGILHIQSNSRSLIWSE